MKTLLVMIPKGTFLNFIQKISNARLTEGTETFKMMLVVFLLFSFLLFDIWRMIVFAEGSEVRRAEVIEEMDPGGDLVVRDLFDVGLSGTDCGDGVIDVKTL